MARGPGKRDKASDPTTRELIYEEHEKRMGLAPETETAEEAPVKEESNTEDTQKGEYSQGEVQEEKQEQAQEAPQEEKAPEQAQQQEEKPKRKYADRFETPEDMEQGYLEATKKMTEESMKRSEYEKAFTELRPYIDWNRIRQAQTGQPPPQPTSPPPVDKEAFFADFANRGPQTIDDHLLRSPALQHVVANAIRMVAPAIVQNAAQRVRLDDAYMSFNRDYPHLKNFEEDVGKLMFEDIRQNPKKSLMSAMHDAAKSMQSLLDKYKEQGKKEAQTIHEERKVQNLPPGDRASKDRVGPVVAKPPQEEQPESLADYISNRRKASDKRRSNVGYQHIPRR